jgi:tRNA-2-methylthio-N6-dimethylallyladenosine synthase
MDHAPNPDLCDGKENAMPTDREAEGKRVFIETYGCQMNLADSELIGGILSRKGFRSAETLENADIILINTCAVRERAEERVFGRLSHLMRYKTRRPDLVLGVMGCMANHLKTEIVDRAPYVDVIIGPDSYRDLPNLLGKARQDAADPQVSVRLDREETYEGLVPIRTEGVGAWITVQRGCDKFCTFCVVPFTRGRERGVPLNAILDECHRAAQAGFKEVTLLGQTVNSYRWEGLDFADLLERIIEVPGIERIRFTSPYPTDFTPKLLATMAAHDKISKHLHLPLQSGSDSILGAMKRQYTVENYLRIAADIRRAMPEISISTDIIVGFPGETEEDFEKTCDLLETIRFDFAYLFRYSERGPTFAARNLADDVPENIKKARLKRLNEIQDRISTEVFRSRIGSRAEILIQGPSRRSNEQLCGRTDDFKMVVLPKPADTTIRSGDLVSVTIQDATSRTLFGHLITDQEALLKHQGESR